MDPKACLNRLADAFEDGDEDEARAALRDYTDWRRKGGFEPTMADGMRGDEFALRYAEMMSPSRRER